MGIPTDCPQREKNGWAGDAQLACETGLTHFQSAAAYTRWMKEFKSAQIPDGGLYGVIPDANWGADVGPPWESAYLLISWFVYQHFGDVGILTNNYAGMKAYVDYLTSMASGNIVSFGLGDWVPAKTTTSSGVTGTTHYYEDALIAARTAAFLGLIPESLQYSNLATHIKISFNKKFYDPKTKQYAGETLTAQSCALYEGLVEDNQVSGVADALAVRVQQGGNTVDTGIIGSKYLLRVLCDNGHSDRAWAGSRTFQPALGSVWGTLGQLTFPAILAVSFWRKREAVSFAASVLWFFENWLNLGRYMADARAQLLPLVSRGCHDWAEIFGRWGDLSRDNQIATIARATGWLGMIAPCLWIIWRWSVDRKNPPPADQAGLSQTEARQYGNCKSRSFPTSDPGVN